MSVLTQFFPAGGGSNSIKANLLVVGGGGGGVPGTNGQYLGQLPGPNQYRFKHANGGGGGGAGAFFYYEGCDLTPGETYTITIGSGGGNCSNGSPTVFTSPTGSNVIAAGGGSGSCPSPNPTGGCYFCTVYGNSTNSNPTLGSTGGGLCITYSGSTPSCCVCPACPSSTYPSRDALGVNCYLVDGLFSYYFGGNAAAGMYGAQGGAPSPPYASDGRLQQGGMGGGGGGGRCPGPPACSPGPGGLGWTTTIMGVGCAVAFGGGGGAGGCGFNATAIRCGGCSLSGGCGGRAGRHPGINGCNGCNGTANLGGGGGGGGGGSGGPCGCPYTAAGNGGSGGSGVVIVQYPTNYGPAPASPGATNCSPTTPGWYTYRFNGPGSITLP